MVKAIAHSYWRRIKAGARKFANVPESVKEDVRTLAKADVQDGVISTEEYLDFIGEEYPSVE